MTGAAALFCLGAPLAGRIEGIEDARRLRQRLLDEGRAWHEQLVRWRRLLNRETERELEALGQALPKRLRAAWDPYQADDAAAEVEDVAALLVANEPDLELVLTKPGASATQGQQLEDALTAFYQQHWPPEFRADAYKAVLGDGIAVEAWDKLAPGAAVRAYGDRAGLRAYAEGADDGEPAESARGRYRQAYQRAAGTDEERHNAAYREVTDEALREDGARWRHRLVDPLAFYAFIRRGASDAEVTVGMEDEITDVHPAVEALAGYGVRLVGTELRCGDADALGGESAPADGIAVGSCDSGQQGRVRYTQIRTRDQVVVLVEGVGGTDGDALFVSLDQPFAGSTGYYVKGGRTKLRGSLAQRFQPVILPLLVEQQIFNEVETARLAMAWAEASREEVQLDAPLGGPQPYDATQREAAKPLVSGDAGRPVVGGEVKRVETTGVDMAAMAGDHLARMQAFRSREFFSGSGAASESGRHLAQTQTAQLTKLVPIQTRFAASDKRQLLDVVAVHARTGEPLHVQGVPALDKRDRQGVQQVRGYVVTQELARLPFDLRVTIGADTPQAQWAKQQVSREEVQFGTYGLSDHRDIVGVRNPTEAVRRMTLDALTRAFFGTAQEPGVVVQAAIQVGMARMQEIKDAMMPPPPQAMSQAMPQVMPGGPDAAGTAGTPASGAGAGGVFVPPAVPGQPSAAGPLPDVAGAGAVPV